jgi:hypothetical protein
MELIKRTKKRYQSRPMTDDTQQEKPAGAKDCPDIRASCRNNFVTRSREKVLRKDEEAK